MNFWKTDLERAGIPAFRMPPPRNKFFVRIEAILNDAEKYDREEEFNISNKILTILKEEIEQYTTREK